MMKKIGHVALMILLSPFILAIGLGLAMFGFMGWAGKDVMKRDTAFLWVVFTVPGLIGWIICIAEAGFDWRPDTWLRWLIRIGYGLMAMYAFFSLDRAEDTLKKQFPSMTETQQKWALYLLIAINVPIIFTVFGSFGD